MKIGRIALLLFCVVIITFSSCSKSNDKDIYIDKGTVQMPDTTVQPAADTPTQSTIDAENEATADVSSDKTELFVEIEKIHGILFDDEGNMYIGKEGMAVLLVKPDKSVSQFAGIENLADKTDKTHVWSFALGFDNNIYAAAGDRILKIDPDGNVHTHIKDDFEGEWGACDVKFDDKGNMYVVHGKKVEKYDRDKKKTTIVDGADGEVQLRAAIGIGFDQEYKNMYLSDLFGGKVLKYPMNSDGNLGEPKIFDGIMNPEYIAVDKKGCAFVTLPGRGGLAKINPDTSMEILTCQNELAEPTTLAFGKKGFDEDSLYVISKGKIYKVLVVGE